jgi:IMP dehydrogenase
MSSFLVNKALKELQNFRRSYDFNEVSMEQQKNICKSRLDVDISSEVFRGVVLEVPMLASNMNTVVNSDFCIKLSDLGALGILHRVGSDEFLVSECKKIAKKCKWVAFSIGVGDSQYELAKKMIKVGGNICFIDIAHGYANIVIDLGRKLKKEYKNDLKVIVGNTINPNMMKEVNDFADGVRCGIGSGFCCSTKDTAGCFEKQFSVIYKFRYISRKLGLPIISDGGIRIPSDFSKAIGAGASSIMAGSIFAKCPESAAEIVTYNDKLVKMHYGLASRTAQNVWKGGVKEGTCTEGELKYIEIGQSVKELIEKYSGALRSGITYSGANNIKSFQKRVKFIRLV